jgi:hypothetical protein
MSRLEIVDLGFCETVPQNSVEVTGGLFLVGLNDSLFELIKNPVAPDLTAYNTTTIAIDPTTVVNKLDNPQTGAIGYEVLSNDGNSKSRSLILFGGGTITNSPGTKGFLTFSASFLSTSLK